MGHGIARRSRAEAQANALSKNPNAHPTAGKPRPESVREKIAERLADHWELMPWRDRRALIAARKAAWEAKPPEERAALQKAGRDAARKARREGSALEREILKAFAEAGHDPVWRPGFCDVWVPSLGVAVEVCGPSHVKPVWGKVSLLKAAARRAEAESALPPMCRRFVRVTQTSQNLSAYRRRLFAAGLVMTAEQENTGGREVALEV